MSHHNAIEGSGQLLPTRDPVDQPLERYVAAHLARLSELFEAGFSYRALTYLLRRVGFPSANHRSLGTVMERRRRLSKAPSERSSARTGASQGPVLDRTALAELGSQAWE